MNALLGRISGKLDQIRLRFLTPKFPKIEGFSGQDAEGLGSDYGRKFVITQLLPSEITLVSGGVGEDISFDVEFLSKYRAKAFLFDPTPRAIQHIGEVVSRFGQPSITSYSDNGKQSPKSYDLREVNSSNLLFHAVALLNESKKVKFYQPLVSEHVSYSIQNIQNNFRNKGKYVEVDAIGPAEVNLVLSNEQINVLKLDIEGSEYQYLKACFSLQIFPDQILVEIDELHFPSIRSYRIAKKVFRLFLKNNYQLAYRDGYNFTYARKGGSIENGFKSSPNS